MELLKKMASNGRTIICSIHQPRSSIYAMFDDVVLLSKGECIYSGPGGDEVKINFNTI